MLENLLFALAGIGLVAIFVGRHIMIRDTGGDLPMLWIVALRVIPFSELVYMVRHFTQAKKGGIISIVGLWLMVPYAGHELWQTQTQVKQFVEEKTNELTERGERMADGELDEDEFAGMSAEGISAFLKRQNHRLAEKEKLVNQLNARLASWYQQLQQRRSAIAADNAEALQTFNAEAAAYSSLNAIAKEQTAEFLALRTKMMR